MSEATSKKCLSCWWFGHEQHPQDSAPPDEATCMHCGEPVSYSDLVGDTRHTRFCNALRLLWWRAVGRWLPHKCPMCGGRYGCKDDCDGIPF
jgi:hypothetical protein